MDEDVVVEFTGFRDIDESSMAIVNKNVKHYVNKIAGHSKNAGPLHITLKPIHQREKGEKYELHAKITVNGKFCVSEFVDRNLFVAIDTVLKKIMHEMEHP